MDTTRRFSLSATIVVAGLLSTALTAQLRTGDSACGSDSRTAGSWYARTSPDVEACAGWRYGGSCSTSGRLTHTVDFLGYTNREAAHYDVDLGAAALVFRGVDTASFEMRVAGSQVVSTRFSGDRSYSLSGLQALLFPGNVTRVVTAGYTPVTISGNVLISAGHDLDLTVRNGTRSSVHQKGKMSASARGSVFVLAAGTSARVEYDLRFGTTTLNVDLGASNSLFGSGRICGKAWSYMSPYRLYLRVCARFALGELCSTLVNAANPWPRFKRLVNACR